MSPVKEVHKLHPKHIDNHVHVKIYVHIFVHIYAQIAHIRLTFLSDVSYAKPSGASWRIIELHTFGSPPQYTCSFSPSPLED